MRFVIGILALFFLVEASNSLSVRDPWLSKTYGLRIIGGKDAKPGQFPYQASIQWRLPPILPYTHSCGASILNEYWILTAAHCVTSAPKIGNTNIKVGKHHIFNDNKFTQTHEIALKIVHESYTGDVAPYDIALFKLKTPIKFNERVQPIQLPEQDKVHSGNAVLSGWGLISKNWLPKMTTILQTAVVPIIQNDECKAAIKAIESSGELYPTQMCSGPLDGTTSACSGDSGGPLAVHDKNNKPVLAGIVSWGMYPCGSIGAPSVYTRVSSYVDWINKKMSEN
ncbi:trypsin-1-like [Phymastichus coffea]|uniref:trypsin-1-like n=1 Tax=Phymastichus coffea TaxID=108790 RepID=UPI00273C36AF|nr:trypsin-1-like [Phymastichus coffea]